MVKKEIEKPNIIRKIQNWIKLEVRIFLLFEVFHNFDKAQRFV